MRRVIALEAVLYLLHDGPSPAIALSPHAIADDAAIEDKEPAGVHIEGSAIVVDDRIDLRQAIAIISRVLAIGQGIDILCIVDLHALNPAQLLFIDRLTELATVIQHQQDRTTAEEPVPAERCREYLLEVQVFENRLHHIVLFDVSLAILE